MTTTAPPTAETTETAGLAGLDHYLTELTKIVFQSGMGRAVVEAKWNGFMRAFDGFDTARVAELTSADVDALMHDRRIIRNRRKIEATVTNARRLLDLDGHARDGSGVRAWLRSFESEPSRDRAVIDRFAFVGPASVHQFLDGVGETVSTDCGVPT